ncbi:hypothetical protein CcI49_17150 [Frankia sp. CcI49]|uniref:hypothetical protein n=1 Tax=Frankia sp. CcI49 TaxID=1745382 RepID=UPI0009764D94|nr:hypothetical protein [Frankia sp. CcI49]ONH59668.1 hypothetical protein CcI49_17150 [Frankia sp. CcI49]
MTEEEPWTTPAFAMFARARELQEEALRESMSRRASAASQRSGHQAMTPVPQRDDQWLASAPPEEVARAYGAGELSQLLGDTTPTAPVPGAQWSDTDLATASPSQVSEALARGDLRSLLEGEDGQPGGGEAA